MTYAISTDQENYHGSFETKGEAIAEALHRATRFWIGTTRPPRQPEKFIDVDFMIDGIGDGHEDWGGDWAEWDGPSRAQIAELQKEFEQVMAAWLDRNKLRPRWFCVDETEEYVVIDGHARIASEVLKQRAAVQSEPTKETE